MSGCIPDDVKLSRLERRAYKKREENGKKNPLYRMDTNTCLVAPPDFKITPSYQRRTGTGEQVFSREEKLVTLPLI